MTGRLRGTLFGRPVELDAGGRDLVLRIADLRSAWRLRRCATSSMLPLLHALRSYGIALRLGIGSRNTVEVLPNPGLLLRLIVPALNLTSSGETA